MGGYDRGDEPLPAHTLQLALEPVVPVHCALQVHFGLIQLAQQMQH